MYRLEENIIFGKQKRDTLQVKVKDVSVEKSDGVLMDKEYTFPGLDDVIGIKSNPLIRYPFPDMRLSANSRKDRRALTSIRQTARELGFYITKDHGLELSGEHTLELYLLICPPDRRRRDDDNIEHAFKSTRDGIFQALGLDDRLVRRTVREWGEVEKDGAVYVRITEMMYG